MPTIILQEHKMNRPSRSGISNIFIISVAFISLILGYYTAKFCAVYFFGYKDVEEVSLQEQIEAALSIVQYAKDNFGRIVNGEVKNDELVAYRNDVYWPAFFKLRPPKSDGSRGSINEGPFCVTLQLGQYLELVMDQDHQEFTAETNEFNKKFDLDSNNVSAEILSNRIEEASAEIEHESTDAKRKKTKGSRKKNKKGKQASLEEQVDAALSLVQYATDNYDRIVDGKMSEDEIIFYRKNIFWPALFILRPADSDGNRGSIHEGPFSKTLELGNYVFNIDLLEEHIASKRDFEKKLGLERQKLIDDDFSRKIEEATAEIEDESNGTEHTAHSGEKKEDETSPSKSNSQVGPLLVVPETTAPIPNGPEGIKFLTSKAEQGDADAQLRLGIRYYNGDGTTKNPEEAVVWFRKAAEQGNMVAQYYLGIHYYNGDGTAKNTEEAVAWFRKAAEQGHGEAQYRLAKCYCDGIGVQQDYTEGIRWHQKAAEQGIVSSQCFLAISYYTGEGVEQNYSEAFNWAQRAANQDDVLSQCLLGDCYSEGHGVAENLEKAVIWYRKSAEQGFAKAQTRLGYCYFEGKGIERDPIEAIKWIEKAAEQGSVGAQYNLGVCYYEGDGIEQDYGKSLKWFSEAAKQGDSDAQCKTGVCYMLGQGVDPNSTEAVKWFHKSAEQGNAEAQYFLGLCYEEGDGVEKNVKEAAKWYKLAADQGDTEAAGKLQRISSPNRTRRNR